jgi:hypothetical protein
MSSRWFLRRRAGLGNVCRWPTPSERHRHDDGGDYSRGLARSPASVNLIVPKAGTREIWVLENGGGGWDHPIHIHFEEGIILARNGSAAKVPAWERGRKDVYRLLPDATVTVSIQFRDFGWMFMEHCHNLVHEDNAMLMRWEIDDGGDPFLKPLPSPIPTPQGVTFFDPDDVLPTAFDPRPKR